MKQSLRSFLTLGLLLWTSIVAAATGDILSVTVRADGFSVDVVVEGFTTGASYDFGLGADNTLTGTEKLRLTATSLGYDATGAATTVPRDLVLKGTVRKATPNEGQVDETGGGNLTFRAGLNFPIFAKDKSGGGNSGTDVTAVALAGLVVNAGGGSQSSNARSSFTVTNNSTLPYPKVVGRWAQPSFERWTGAKLVEMVCYHPFARNNKPVACVAFDCTDGSNPITQQIATSCTASTQWTGVGNTVWTYGTTIPVSGFTQGATLTGRFRAYPWVGDSTSILDTDTSADGIAAPSAALTPLMGFCDKNDSLACYASVNGVGGSPAVSATKAGARAAPYSTLALALTALKTYNNSTNSDNSLNNCYVLMQDGSYSAAGTFTGSNTKTWCVVAADLENGATQSGVNFSTATNQAFNGYIKYQDVTFSGVGSGMHRGNITTGCLWLDSCTYSHAVAAQWYSWNTAFLTGTTFTAGTQNILGSGSGGVGWGLVRQNDLTAITAKQACANCCIGNKNILPTFAIAGGTNGPQSDGGFVGWNSTYAIASTTQWLFEVATGNWTKGIAVVGNVAERIGGNTSVLCQFIADNTTTSVANNVYFAHNTLVGARWNLNYLELGNYSPNRFNWYDQYNVLVDWNCKTDKFSNAVRTVTDGILVNGSTTVSSATAAFVAGDVAQNISFNDNQIANAITTIASQTGTAAVMNTASLVDATGVTLYIRSFGKNRNRVSNWATVNGCGQIGMRSRIATFPPENYGINSKIGTINFVDDKSYISIGNTGAGGGDYHGATGSSILSTVPSGGALLPGDLDGRAISNTGSGASGALQLQSSNESALQTILRLIGSDILFQQD